MPAFAAISSPTTEPGPVTRLKTPAGSSASTTHWASLTEHTDVALAGPQTTVFPEASAGATTSAAIVYGQFHGVITPTTPRGTRYASTRLDASTDGGMRPSSRRASPAAMRQYSMSSSTSEYDSERSGLPWSSVSVCARSSRRFSMIPATRSIAAARSNAERPAHSRAAAFAAAIARWASSRVPSGTVPMVSPVAGLVASMRPPESLSTHAPATYIE